MAAPPTFALTTVANEIRVPQLRQHNLQQRRIFLKRYVLFDFFAVKFSVRRIVSFRLDLDTCEKAMKPGPGAPGFLMLIQYAGASCPTLPCPLRSNNCEIAPSKC